MSVSDSHNRAMEFAERAFMAQIRGPRKNSIEFFERALEYELEAISKLDVEGRTEPTYSVLHPQCWHSGIALQSAPNGQRNRNQSAQSGSTSRDRR